MNIYKYKYESLYFETPIGGIWNFKQQGMEGGWA